MSKRITVLVVVCALLVGCVAGITRYELQPEQKIGKNYIVGEICTASTGSAIIRLENLRIRPCYCPSFEYDPPDLALGVEVTPALSPQQQWQAIWITKDGGYVIFNPAYSTAMGIHILPGGIVGKGWINIALNSVPIQRGWTKERLFMPTEGTPEKGSFVAELVYSGLSQNTIRIAYREYKDDLARPAFYQELTYDLNESRTILFRTISLEIIEATNSYLKYRVIDDGGLPWMPKE